MPEIQVLKHTAIYPGSSRVRMITATNCMPQQYPRCSLLTLNGTTPFTDLFQRLRINWQSRVFLPNDGNISDFPAFSFLKSLQSATTASSLFEFRAADPWFAPRRLLAFAKKPWATTVAVVFLRRVVCFCGNLRHHLPPMFSYLSSDRFLWPRHKVFGDQASPTSCQSRRYAPLVPA